MLIYNCQKAEGEYKMKTYYYNGEKVRTSNNQYTHAVVIGKTVIACCSRYDLAIKRAKSEYSYRLEQIQSLERSYNENPSEDLRNYIENRKNLLETIKVVELEIK